MARIVLLLLLLLSAGLYAQEPDAFCEKGERLFERGQYQAALPLLAQCAQAKPREARLQQKLNECRYFAGDVAEAVRGFRQMQQDFKKIPLSNWLYLGRSLQALGQFEEAAQAYKDFLRHASDDDPRRPRVRDDLLRCATGIHLQGQPGRAFVQNMGNILNSPGDELRPLPHPKNEKLLYFSSSRPGTLGGKRNEKGEADPNGKQLGDMFYAQLQTTGWSAPQTLSSLLNSTRYDIPMGFSPDGELFYFFQGYSTYSGEIFIDTFRQIPDGGSSLFALRFQSPMQTAAGDTDPFWFADTVLLFASRREGGYGGLDLYITQLRDGAWTTPQNLGPEINTPYDERAPFLARDGRTLYFSTNQPERSFGGLDIMRAVFNDLLARWTKPYNLGLELNSAYDDTYFYLSAAGDKAFFSSSRPGGSGGFDLYLALFSEARSEQRRYSEPLLFSHVLEQFKAEENEESLSDFYLEPLYLEEEGSALSPDNLQKLRRLLQLMHAYPQLDLLLTAHTDPLDYDSYPLFFSLKKVEEVSDFLMTAGLSPNRIHLRTVGDNYPVAKSTYKASPARHFNRRIDIAFTGLEDVPAEVVIKKPPVTEELRDPKGQAYFDLIAGLNYRILLTESQQLFPSDVQLSAPHATIEKDPATGLYRFTAGLFRSYSAAQGLLKQMQQKGFHKARIIPYLNDLPLSRQQALAYLQLYPELQEWLEEN